MGDELVHAADDDVDQVDGDDGRDLPRGDGVVTVTQVEDDGGDEDLGDGEHEMVNKVGVELFVVVAEE